MTLNVIKNDCMMEYVSIGCNRTTQVLAWGKNDLIAYGACRSVVLYQPENDNVYAGKIVHVLNGHKGEVYCVQWLSENELISGSSDKSIIVWTRRDKTWQFQQQLTGHNNVICSLASVTYGNNTYIASASSDSTVKLFKRQGKEDFQCVQTISFGNGFSHTLAMSILPSLNGVMLACGCDDMLIKIYTLQNNMFVHVLSLSGHEDWVRCLVFTNTGLEDDLLLASGSQDCYIRLWRICKSSKQQKTKSDLSLKEQSFISNDEKSVLIGHDGWVLGVSWSMSCGRTPSLLSTSMDKSTIVWEYDEMNQVWIDTARMGDVGGNTLGYYGCAFAPDGKSIIAHGYQGAFRMWKKNKDTSKWQPMITISGHFGEVEDFDWDVNGRFAITASTDQTTRLFSPWKRDKYYTTWHEIARPQVHGYDMKCIVMVGKYKFASGAQEKVIRVFSAPRAFYDSFLHISKVCEEEEVLALLPLGATVPVLGLSNKAVYEGDIKSWDNQSTRDSQPMKASAFANEDPAPFNPTLISAPPIEDVLVQNTLWPEVQKLYGHGFELFAISASPDGTTLATACKASRAEYANIIIWDSTTWSQKDSLNAHSLTVTQLCFSRSGIYLLSVSRDRTWALHKRTEHSKFSLVQKTDKKSSIHTRIIWSCDWFYDENHFVTASRDKRVIVWGRNTNDQCWSAMADSLDVGESATAVSVHSLQRKTDKYVIAVGLESGGIVIYAWLNAPSSNWRSIHRVDTSLCPTLMIKRLRWRPKDDDCKDNKLFLGACSSDHSFRILKFNLSLFTQ
ncbi:elongator complex protein 2-like isoform X2 [Hydractinia symbiolongicarpus]|uniref:elongator complex protein 2-like isoform X2 n=1 Tax=Hydractinia symbiolongicarpus TaxID=13093 RepID=UPI00254F2A10|nr:elongator complex protein 2-like isoform X2 [Hydractinia symbiolongicarpus]